MHSFCHTPVKLNIRILHIRTVHEVQFSGVAAVVKNLSFNLFVDAFISTKAPACCKELEQMVSSMCLCEVAQHSSSSE